MTAFSLGFVMGLLGFRVSESSSVDELSVEDAYFLMGVGVDIDCGEKPASSTVSLGESKVIFFFC